MSIHKDKIYNVCKPSPQRGVISLWPCNDQDNKGKTSSVCFSEHCSKERNQIMDILDEDVPHRSGDKTRIKKAKKKKGERSF